ncbi:MAG: hypothetical protein E7270_11150 [Lachnospiraceae bacterium]|nr:hypothetical protein [Lachnospiraceae bacterium]
MKYLKIVLMVILMIMMFDMMTIKAEASTKTEDGYTYSTDGTHTSNTLIYEERIVEYDVVEKDIIASKKINKKMIDYLVAYNTQYTIPGLRNTNVLGENCDTMVPQGICRMDNYTLVTAYDYEEEFKSVIYVIDTSGKLQATLVYNKKCHMGGIAYDGKYVWIAEGGKGKYKNGVGAISKSVILEAVKISKAKGAKSIKLKNIKWTQAKELESTSYCTYFDNKLWIGTFDKHNSSDIYGYITNCSGSKPTLNPCRYILTRMRTQGITFYKDSSGVYLGVSTSYGRKNDSVIRCYKLDDYYAPEFTENGVPEIWLESAYRTITLPPMLEQITVHGVFMYVIFESGARPYVDGSDGNGKATRVMSNYCILSAESIFK